ncbi:hypothetical protein FB45DRAFT_1064704 [Roridomyces roridus]|uniref:Uncharacterized protein n=1 Tax=Roridomyces roridus TaxID=1738132 RepID=A0AAD7B9R9_9AGAR|nr:hypothetical protein FB45DRAFT_1064704 [Roridomyces roridus]
MSSNPDTGPAGPPPEDVIRTIQATSFMTSAEMFLYGAYVVLFGFYVTILRKPGEFQKNRFLHSATITLFPLSTIHLALLLSITAVETSSFVYSMQMTAPIELVVRAAFGVYVTSNVIADSIFVFRCYAIWSFRRRVIIIPMLCTMGIAGVGYWHVSQGLTLQAFFLFDINIISLSNTIILMILSAGRIWWLARTARKIMGYKTAVTRYYTVCAMILESGALYGIGAALMASLVWVLSRDYVVISGAVTGQLVGIAPTIIAVRVGLNKSVESVDSFAIMVQRPRPQLSSSDFRISTTGPVQQPGVICLRPESITEVQKIATV